MMNLIERLHNVTSKTHPTQKGRCSMLENASVGQKAKAVLGISLLGAIVGLLAYIVGYSVYVYDSWDDGEYGLYALVFSVMISVGGALVLIGAQATMLFLNKRRYLKPIQMIHIFLSSSILSHLIILYMQLVATNNGLSIYDYGILLAFVSVFLVSVLIFCTIHRER